MSRRRAYTLKRLLDLIAMICGAGLLAGCGGRETPPVLLPTPVSCIPETLGEPPAYPDSDAALKAAPTPERRWALILAGRALRQARSGEVEPVIAACRKVQP